MKEYQYKGRTYVESGEVRRPKRGDHYLCFAPHEHHFVAGSDSEASMDVNEGKRKILIPKEDKVSEEYDIPMLVKAEIQRLGCAGKVILCRKWKGEMHDYCGQDGNGWNADEVITYPTEAQVKEERGKLKAKADPLPAPVREALNAADLGCRRDGVEKLIEAMYANPPKAEAGK